MKETDRQALDWVEAELDRAFAGAQTHPLLIALQATLRARSLPREPFVRLIEANRLDQRVSRHAGLGGAARLLHACPPTPLASSCWRVFGVRDASHGSRCRTRSAPRCG